MIIEVNEITHRGFRLEHVDRKGWKIVLDGVEILFPHLQAAQAAIEAFYRDVVPAQKGERIKWNAYSFVCFLCAFLLGIDDFA